MIIFDILPATSDQWVITFYFFLILSAVIGFAEFLSRSFKLTGEFTRKFVHVSVGVLVFIFSLFINNPQPLLFLCLIFSIINFFIIRFNLVPALNSNRKSYGTVFYPFAIFLAIIFLWTDFKIIFFNIILILALADAMAAIVGQSIKKPIYFHVLQDKKSVQGSSSMFLSALFIIIILHFFMADDIHLNFSILIIAPALAFVITLAEAISSKGSDNLSISIISGFFLFVFYFGDYNTQINVFYSIFFSVVFSITSIKLKFLSIDGALTAGMLAILMFSFGGWVWTIPLLTFFTLSSILSYTGKNQKQKLRLMYEKSSKRDAMQVLANGGLGIFFVLLNYIYSSDLLYYFYIASTAYY